MILIPISDLVSGGMVWRARLIQRRPAKAEKGVMACLLLEFGDVNVELQVAMKMREMSL